MLKVKNLAYMYAFIRSLKSYRYPACTCDQFIIVSFTISLTKQIQLRRRMLAGPRTGNQRCHYKRQLTSSVLSFFSYVGYLYEDRALLPI